MTQTLQSELHNIYTIALGKAFNHVGEKKNFLSKNFKFPDLLILQAQTINEFNQHRDVVQ